MKSLVSSTWLLILKLEEGLSACMSSDTCILLVSSSHPSGMSANPCPSLLLLLLELVRCAFFRHHRDTVETGLLDSPSAGSSHGQSHQLLWNVAVQLVYRQDPSAGCASLGRNGSLGACSPCPLQAADVVNNCFTDINIRRSGIDLSADHRLLGHGSGSAGWLAAFQ